VIARAALPALAGGTQLAAALVILGRPNLADARAFMQSTAPTVQETLAVLELLVWVLVAASLAGGLLSVVAAGASAARAVRGRAWEVSVAAIGLVLLSVGLAHHLAPRATLGGGGSVQEAQQAIGR
jgi:hypothetical protein